MSHLTQMVGLTVQNFVSAAAGMAVMVALIRGLARRAVRHGRQLLGRPDPHDAAHPAAARVRRSRSCCVGTGVIQNLHGFDGGARPLEARTQVIPGGPVASQESIKSSARTVAGSSTPTRRTRSRTRTGSPTSSSSSASCSIPFALTVHVRADGGRASGRARVLFAVMVVLWLVVVGLATIVRDRRQPDARPRWVSNQATHDDPAGRQHRGQGGAVRHRRRPRSGAPRPPGRRTARSTRCTTATRRSAG